MNSKLPTILYLFDKGADTFVVFRSGRRTYTKPCKLSGGLYLFSFRRKQWQCYGRRIYD